MYFDLIRLIIRYYKALSAATVMVFILSAIYAYGFLPSLYECNVMFEPGRQRAYNVQERAFINKSDPYFIPPPDLTKKISNGDYDTRLARRLGIQAREFDWKVTNLKGSSWIKVSLYQQEKNRGRKFLNSLLLEIEADIKDVADIWRQTLVLKIKNLQESVMVLESQKKLLETKISELDKRLQLSDKDGVLKSEQQPAKSPNKVGSSDAAGALLYNIAIQQTLTSDVELLMITQKIMDNHYDISMLQNELDILREIEIIGQVEVSDNSNRPNRPAIVVALTILGFICSFVVVLVMEARKNTVVQKS